MIYAVGESWLAAGIRLGRLEVAGQTMKTKVTSVPTDFNAIRSQLGLRELFTQPPGLGFGLNVA